MKVFAVMKHVHHEFSLLDEIFTDEQKAKENNGNSIR